DVLEKVLSAFLSASPELLAAMSGALSRDDALAMHRAAHSLKSSSANVGALKLSAYCKELEALGRANTLTSASAVLESLKAEYAGRMRHREEPLDGGAPLAPQRQREIVDVHEHEAPARLLVDPAPVAHRVLQGLVHVGVGPGDGVPQGLRERAVQIVAEVAAH